LNEAMFCTAWGMPTHSPWNQVLQVSHSTMNFWSLLERQMQ
jgi:hypothetical protein